MTPLWGCPEPTYEDFTAHLARTGGFPSPLPWPLPPGWRVTDFASLGEDGATRATVACVTGATGPDGPVDVLVVVEEPGTGLGSRVAGTVERDPSPDLGQGPASVRVRCGEQHVPLWPVTTSAHDAGLGPEFDRSALAGPLAGRWLWVVVRPAPALLLLSRPWSLSDAHELGPLLVEVDFQGPAPRW